MVADGSLFPPDRLSVYTLLKALRSVSFRLLLRCRVLAQRRYVPGAFFPRAPLVTRDSASILERASLHTKECSPAGNRDAYVPSMNLERRRTQPRKPTRWSLV